MQHTKSPSEKIGTPYQMPTFAPSAAACVSTVSERISTGRFHERAYQRSLSKHSTNVRR
jgi:hypothetical protein